MLQIKPDSLGKAGEGFHVHVGGIAILDTLATAGAAYLLAKSMGWRVAPTIAGAFVLGEVAHWYFQVPTTVTKALKLVPEEA